MTKILGIPGALRRGSYNHALLRAAVEVAPAGVAIEIAQLNAIPPYDGDLESAHAAEGGFPPTVAELRARWRAADAVLLASPEYNHSIPGVLKNALDWISRAGPAKESLGRGKAVAIMGATNGNGGTRIAQAAWLAPLRAIGARAYAERMMFVSDGPRVFDAEGKLVDPKVRESLAAFVAGFAAEVERGRR